MDFAYTNKILYTIIIFSIIIILLYLYLIVEKLKNNRKIRNRAKYNEEVINFINDFMKELKDTNNISSYNKKTFYKYLNDEVCAEIVEKEMIHFINNSDGDFNNPIIKLLENSKIIDDEIKKLKDKDNNIKALACKRLGEFRSRRAVKYLLEYVTSTSIDVQYNALLAISLIGDEKIFIEAFSKVDSSTLLSERSLVEIVDSFNGDKETIYKTMINNENEFIACIFIKSAGNLKNPALGEQISKYLKDVSKEKRISAVKALGNMADTRYTKDIIELLHDKEWEVRAIAAKELGKFKDKSVIDSLIKLLSDSEWFVRYNAAFSILNLDDKFEFISKVFKGTDKFAKDIILYVIENNGLYSKIHNTKSKNDKPVTNELISLIDDYINEKDKEKINEHVNY